MKKIITIIALVLLLCTLSFTAFASDTQAKEYDFTADYSESSDDMLGFKVKDGFNTIVMNGKLSTVCSFGIPVTFILEDNDISQYDYAVFMLKSDYFNENSVITVRFPNASGESVEENIKLTSKDFCLYSVKLPEAETSSIEIFVNSVSPDGDMFAVELDYLRLEKTETLMLLSIDKDTASVNCEEKKLDSPALIRNDFTLTPARFVAENAGANVDWIGEERKVVITKGETVIELVIDSTTAVVNGKEVTMDIAPCIINDFTYTPARFVAENLGCNVEWEPSTRTVIITN